MVCTGRVEKRRLMEGRWQSACIAEIERIVIQITLLLSATDTSGHSLASGAANFSDSGGSDASHNATRRPT